MFLDSGFDHDVNFDNVVNEGMVKVKKIKRNFKSESEYKKEKIRPPRLFLRSCRRNKRGGRW